MPRSSWAREPQLLSLRVWSLCSTTREAAIVRGLRTAMKSGPCLPQLEKALAQKEGPNTAKNKLINLKYIYIYKFILLQLCKSEISFPGLKLRYHQDWFLLEALKGAFSLPFLASRGHLHSLVCGPFLHLQITSLQVSASIITSPPFLLWSNLPLPLSSKDTSDYI